MNLGFSTPPGAAIYNHIIGAFHARRLAAPSVIIGTQLAGLRGDLLASGRYIAPLPRSIFNLYAKQFPLKVLPVDLPVRPLANRVGNTEEQDAWSAG